MSMYHLIFTARRLVANLWYSTSMEIVVICDNIRSAHNMGSLLRTCDGLGINQVYVCGVTPYPKIKDDMRLPYIAEKLTKQIHKTALGAEKFIQIIPVQNTTEAVTALRDEGFHIFALEQVKNAIQLDKPSLITPMKKCAIILGSEVEGIQTKTIGLCDTVFELPMQGHKESYNVSVAAGIALYYLRYMIQ